MSDVHKVGRLFAVIGRLALVACICLLAGCIGPAEYSSAEFSGVVKDKATGAPIEGAIVVAAWRVSRANLHGSVRRVLHTSEAVTDRNGKYTLPAWGPKPRPAFWVLDIYDTSALIVKPGYDVPEYVGHNTEDTGVIPPPMRPESLLEAKIENPDSYATTLGAVSRTSCCDPLQLEGNPNLIRLLDAERRRLAGLGVKETWLEGIVDIGKLDLQQQRTLEQGRKPQK